jgi:hypothetical protein
MISRLPLVIPDVDEGLKMASAEVANASRPRHRVHCVTRRRTPTKTDANRARADQHLFLCPLALSNGLADEPPAATPRALPPVWEAALDLQGAGARARQAPGSTARTTRVRVHFGNA